MDGFIEPTVFTVAQGAAPPPQSPAEWLVPQRWESYTPAEHATWLTLVDRQAKGLEGRACEAFVRGLHALDLRGDGIPEFEALSDRLEALTGWRIVPVEGLVPDKVFVQLLAKRQFPAGRFIRAPHQLDYIEAPDVFHDVFGHVPMLTDPAFADFMQAYGEAGVRAAQTGHLEPLARLYWFTVEFGLLKEPEGLRLYGAGLASSPAEAVHSLESPQVERRPFQIAEVTATPFRTDVMQPLYFVIDSFDSLLALAGTEFTG